jgi:hypothetical protein
MCNNGCRPRRRISTPAAASGALRRRPCPPSNAGRHAPAAGSWTPIRVPCPRTRRRARLHLARIGHGRDQARAETVRPRHSRYKTWNMACVLDSAQLGADTGTGPTALIRPRSIAVASGAPPSAYQMERVGLWDRVSNLTGWNALLGERRGTGAVSCYAAPARASDLRGLAPAFRHRLRGVAPC